MERQRHSFLARATMTLLLAMLTTVGAWATITGSGTQTDPYVLNDAADWATFANSNNANTYWGSNVYVKLSDTWDNSSNAVTAMVGTNGPKFCGTFNGNGKTLTLALTTDGNEFTAPFRYVNGATIKLLHTAGTVNGGNQKYATGLIGMSYGTVTITSCHSSVAITSDRSNLGNDQRDATHGGFIGVSEGTVTFTNCLFDGSITDAAATNCGGFVGWRNGTLTFNNCLMAGTMTLSSTNGTATFSRNNGEKTTLNHCYYKTSYGDVQGTAVGQTSNATLIDNEHLGSAWEISGNNVVPMMNKYNMASVTISGLKSKYFYDNDNAIAISYTVTDLSDTQLTPGTHFNAIITKGGETVNSVTDKGEYVLTLTGLSPYTGTKTLNFSVADADLTISSAEDWNTFANNVSYGETYSGKFVKLASNFDNSATPITQTVGSSDHPFTGTFDGNGKTLNVNISETSTQGTAPFRYISGGAVIKNVTVEGSITGTTHAAGLVGFSKEGTSDKPNTIENCTVNATVTVNTGDNKHMGGVVGHGLSSYLKIKNTVFSGTMTNGGNYAGGLQGWSDGNHLTIDNCIFTGSYSGSGSFHPIAIHNQNSSTTATVSAAYYTAAPTLTDACFIAAAGTQVYTTAQSDFCNKLTLHGNDYYCVGNAVITTPMHYDYNGGSAITVTYAMNYEGAELNADCYTASITKGGTPVTTVTDKGSYILTLTGNNSKGYYGSKSVCFNVLGEGEAGLSEDNEIPVDKGDHYYVNMPTTGALTLTLPDATITTFKVYDDGGWQDDYSNNCNGTLTITAPEGYAIQLSGDVWVATDNEQWNAPRMNRATRRAVPTSDEELGNDYLTVYDGTTTSAPRLGKEKYGNEFIRSLYSTGRSMTLHFQSDDQNSRSGLNLTMKLVSTTTEYNIVIPNGIENGTITASVGGEPATKAKLNDKVTLTITPNDGYRLGRCNVYDQMNQCPVTVADDNTFLMPAGDVEIYGEFIPAVSVTYIDEKGVSKTVLATPIESTDYYYIHYPGFYTVSDTKTIDHAIEIENNDGGNVSLILQHDATLNCNRISGYESNLTIYGQSKGNGTLNAKSINVVNYKQYSGIVNISNSESYSTALYVQNNALIAGGMLIATADGSSSRGIYAKKLTISGGQVTATGKDGENQTTALGCYNSLLLGCSSSKDFIQINGDINLYNTNGTVSITSGQTLTDGTDTYTGVLSDEQISNLKGQTLTPVVANITLANDDSNADAEEKNAAIITDKKGALANVTLADRTLTKDGNWNTLCLPFSMTAAQIASSDLADATIKELDNSDNGTKLDAGKLTLKFNTVTAIEAGKPYIVKWATTGSNISNPVFNDVIISSTAASEVESDDKNVKFVGQYSPFDITDANKNEILYVGSANKIGYSAKARTLKSCRAHFWVKPKETNAPAVNSINIDWGDGETTSLSEELKVNSEKFATATAWYTLDGRKLNAKPNAKGVYINNGRKTVIK